MSLLSRMKTTYDLITVLVGDIFEPVTWHHQRRPFIRALTCKTIKTRRGWPAEPPPTIKSVQYLKKREKRRERD
jgi:hypothetical protein